MEKTCAATGRNKMFSKMGPKIADLSGFSDGQNKVK
jgi:hypothetical protein